VPPVVLALIAAAVLATIVAALATTVAGATVQTWVRRVFLVLINLSPWILGTWRNNFSKRETFLAAWFLTFVAILLVIAFVPGRWQR
jgi:hypothetical protein